MINEILQWLAIGLLFYPKARAFVQDFREEEDDE